MDGLSFAQRFAVKSILLFFLPFIHVENDERIESASDPVIFAFNHNNSIETVLLAAYLLYRRDGAKVHFVVDWVFGSIPLLGRFIRLIEPIFVFNKKPRFKLLSGDLPKQKPDKAWDECVSTLKDNRSIAIFPEGTRNHDPSALMAGRLGIGKIAIASAAPVVPVGVDFRDRSKHGKMPFFGSMTLRVGERLYFRNEIEESNNINRSTNLTRRSKRNHLLYLDKKVLHNVMTELSRLSGKSYPFDPPILQQ